MLLDPELPDRDALAPWLIKLAAHPGSAVVVTIEHRRDTNVPDVRMGWLSKEERIRVRRALRQVNAAREKKGELRLDDFPQ